MHKAKIVKIEKKQIVATGEPFLDVTVEFRLEGAKVFIKKLGYPVGTTEKEIKADLNKHMQTEVLDREQRAQNVKAEAQDAATDQLINNLEGEEIIATEAKPTKVGGAKVKKSGNSKTKGKKT